MTPTEIEAKLTEFLLLPGETEWIEFKEAKANIDFDELGRYFSALSNEANLKAQASGWLVLGISNKPPRQIVGSNYRLQSPGLDKLKGEIAKHTNHQITFQDIHVVHSPEGRVVLFQIPAAPRGIPTQWNGKVFGRHGESISTLSLQEIDQIRQQGVREDWSAQVCIGASTMDLDPKALAFSRQEYKTKNPGLASEVDTWSDETLLNKSKLSIDGKITRAAIILLGKAESDHHLPNCHPQLTWILKDKDGFERDYKHFSPPLLLAVNPLLTKVRNLTCRVLPWGTLFPVEVLQYDPWVLREVLHNAVAHQDYAISGRINVVEFEDRLVIANHGSFLPGDVESVIRRDAPMSIYRNNVLAQAMVNLGMIDTIGSGIKRIFLTQKKRSFPMPDYDLSIPNEVKVVIRNSVMDERYTRMLLARTELDLWDVIALDKVQKGVKLSDAEFKSLKRQKLVEGRRTNLFVSAEVAKATDTVEDYLAKRGIDRHYCKKMICDLVVQKGEARREDIDSLLRKKLSDALSEDQKSNFIRNLIQEMKKEGLIVRVGSSRGKKAGWRLSKSSEKQE
jgi:ATP-dependent DNA helicase RecG